MDEPVPKPIPFDRQFSPYHVYTLVPPIRDWGPPKEVPVVRYNLPPISVAFEREYALNIYRPDSRYGVRVSWHPDPKHNRGVSEAHFNTSEWHTQNKDCKKVSWAVILHDELPPDHKPRLPEGKIYQHFFIWGIESPDPSPAAEWFDAYDNEKTLKFRLWVEIGILDDGSGAPGGIIFNRYVGEEVKILPVRDLESIGLHDPTRK